MFLTDGLLIAADHAQGA